MQLLCKPAQRSLLLSDPWPYSQHGPSHCRVGRRCRPPAPTSYWLSCDLPLPSHLRLFTEFSRWLCESSYVSRESLLWREKKSLCEATLTWQRMGLPASRASAFPFAFLTERTALAGFRACFSGKKVLTSPMLCWMAKNFGSFFLPPELADPHGSDAPVAPRQQKPRDSMLGRWSCPWLYLPSAQESAHQSSSRSHMASPPGCMTTPQTQHAPK